MTPRSDGMAQQSHSVSVAQDLFREPGGKRCVPALPAPFELIDVSQLRLVNFPNNCRFVEEVGNNRLSACLGLRKPDHSFASNQSWWSSGREVNAQDKMLRWARNFLGPMFLFCCE